MFKQVAFHGVLNERTGYGVHASRFCEALSKMIPVEVNGNGDVHVSMWDSVSIQNVNEKLPYPSIVYNVWESTEQPQWFIDKLKFFDQLWVASEWQRSCSIAQGIPEEFVKVVPEGVDPDIYKPADTVEFGNFNFVHVGQWQPRKSTLEICQAFIKAFPDNPKVRLYLSADTLFPSDNYKSTEERLQAYGVNDPRIIPIHFEERETYIRRLQAAHVFVSCSRSEGWGLPLIESMACFPVGTEVVANDVCKSMSRKYSGPLIRIELSDTIIEATPEHPFWTNKGWKLAKELDIECQLLYCPQYGGHKYETIYAGRVEDVAGAISNNYPNGVIYDDGEKLFLSAMAETSDGYKEKSLPDTKVSSLGYKCAGYELSGRDYRWRGDCYVKKDPDEMEAIGNDCEHVPGSSGVDKGNVNRPIDVGIMEDRQNGEQMSIIPMENGGDRISSILQGIGTILKDQETSNASGNRILRDALVPTFAHQEYSNPDQSYIEDSESQYKPIRSLSTREVEDLPVFNFKTKSGMYTASGYLVHNCGIPTIVADWSGSTEYAYDAIKVRIRELKKPEGIYGNWDVPGQWAEPDYDHLAEVMSDTYENYANHKEKALKTSDMIRTKFSWAAAAEKAMAVLEELSIKSLSSPEIQETPKIQETVDPEKKIHLFASKHNYVITSMRPRKAIFTVSCWPDNKEKMDTLAETIKQIHGFGYPVLVSSHFPLPPHITELADYYVFEKRDIMSGDDKPIYWRDKLDGTHEEKRCRFEYQGVAALNCFRNSIDFCRGKYDWIYDMGADMEVDLEKWLSLVLDSEKPMVCIPYEGRKDGIGGGMWAARTEVFDKVIPYLDSWKQYADMYPDVRFVVERWIYNYVRDHYDVNDIGWIDIETTNRFDNVDRNIWDSDEFVYNFIDGPYFHILGMSTREYDVEFNDGTEAVYNLKQKAGVWSRPAKKYFRPWTITAKLDGVEKFRYSLNLKGQRVLISLGSKAMGDTLAWIPYVEEFRKKHECHVICSGWWGHICDYPEIEFINPGSKVENVFATYEVGCFDGQLDKNVKDWRLTILQQVAADILGIEYKPIRTKLKHVPHKAGNGNQPKPYVCFSEFSTMRNKLWNREGAWQKIIDHLNELGYDCVSVSAEQSQLKNIIRHNGQSIEQTLTDVSGAEFYIGLNAGPSWIAYSLNIPCIMITGVSEEWNDFPNPYRVAVNNEVCGVGCFNDPSLPIDRGWEWCPRKKDYICTREITEEMVTKQIDKIREEKGYAIKTGGIERSGVGEHKGDDGVGPSTKTGRRGRPVKRQEVQKEIQA